MATTAQHITARSDTDLLARLIAASEQAGISNAQQAVEQNLGLLIAAPVAEGQCIADVHAYATTVRQEALAAVPPAPGANPSAVTDAHLASAVATLT